MLQIRKSQQSQTNRVGFHMLLEIGNPKDIQNTTENCDLIQWFKNGEFHIPDQPYHKLSDTHGQLKWPVCDVSTEYFYY